MPRTRQSTERPDRDRLYEVAAPQAGYFTVAEAVGAGYSSPLVEYHVRTGRLARVGRGIFRLVHFPPTDNEDLVVSWLWSQRTGVCSHLTALALHQLFDVLPAKAHMTVPASWGKRRLRIPDGLLIHYADVARSDIEWNGPVPLTKPLRTVVDVVLADYPEFGQQAAAQGVKRGLFSRQDLRMAIAARKSIEGKR